MEAQPYSSAKAFSLFRESKEFKDVHNFAASLAKECVAATAVEIRKELFPTILREVSVRYHRFREPLKIPSIRILMLSGIIGSAFAAFSFQISSNYENPGILFAVIVGIIISIGTLTTIYVLRRVDNNDLSPETIRTYSLTFLDTAAIHRIATLRYGASRNRFIDSEWSAILDAAGVVYPSGLSNLYERIKMARREHGVQIHVHLVHATPWVFSLIEIENLILMELKKHPEIPIQYIHKGIPNQALIDFCNEKAVGLLAQKDSSFTSFSAFNTLGLSFIRSLTP